MDLRQHQIQAQRRQDHMMEAGVTQLNFQINIDRLPAELLLEPVVLFHPETIRVPYDLGRFTPSGSFVAH